jgi:hypothetical protein
MNLRWEGVQGSRTKPIEKAELCHARESLLPGPAGTGEPRLPWDSRYLGCRCSTGHGLGTAP